VDEPGRIYGGTGPSIAAHVYLNGTIIFIAGLATVRTHNVCVARYFSMARARRCSLSGLS
jgi:hypothetical protein